MAGAHFARLGERRWWRSDAPEIRIRLGVCGLISHRIDFGGSARSREFCLMRVREGRLQIAKLKLLSCGEREY